MGRKRKEPLPIPPSLWICRNVGPKLVMPGKERPKCCTFIRYPFGRKDDK